MIPHYQDEHATVYHGDCLDVLLTLAGESIDSVVTDPPYELTAGKKGGTGPASINLNSPAGRARTSVGQGGFMGKSWDATGIGFDPAVWRECLRVLKPGGYLVAFGGTRTYHRLACAVEDAGFEIRDSLHWIYGSGFPKSLDVSKAIDRAAGELPPEGTAFTVAGVYNDRMQTTAPSRGYVPPAPKTDAAQQWQGFGTALKPAHEPIVLARKPFRGSVAGNVLQHGTGALNIDGCRVAAQGRPLIQSASESSTGIFGDGLNGSSAAGTTDKGRWPPNVLLDDTAATELDQQSGHTTSGKMRAGVQRANRDGWAGPMPETTGTETYGDEGGASRFFPVFKYEPKAPGAERPTVDGAQHPTVKPLDLMRWLVRLVTPPGGLILDPFAGSGTTAEACIHEHRRCVTIEREAEYLPLIVARLRKPMQVGFDFG